MSNIFKQFREYQSRKVDNPEYKPLGQSILVLTPEEEKKRKRKEYAKEYYRKNKERLRAQQKEYWRRTHADGNHKSDMIGNQKRVYEYLLEQYRKGKDSPRGTEIAKALGISDNSVYTAIFHLTKRGYVGRGSYGRYLLLKFPEGDETGDEKKITYEDFQKTHDDLLGKTYLYELADQIGAGLITQNKELYDENQKLKEQLKQIKEAWIKHEKSVDAYYKKRQNSYSDLDQIIMNR